MSRIILSAHGHSDSVTCLSLSDCCLASGGDDGFVYFWSLNESPIPLYRTPFVGPCSSTKFHPLNANLLYSAHGSSVNSWDLRRLDVPISVWDVNEDEINSIDVLKCGKKLVTSDDSGAALVIDSATGCITRSLKGHGSICSAAIFRPNRSNQLITGGLDCRVVVYDWKNTKHEATIFELNELSCRDMAGSHRCLDSPCRDVSESVDSTGYSEDESDDVSSTTDNVSSVCLNTQEDECPNSKSADQDASNNRASGKVHDEFGTPEQFSTDDPVTGSDAWSFGIPVNPPMVHALACSPSGDVVAAGLEKSTIELFSGEDERFAHVKSLRGHRRAVSTLHFIGNGYLISGSNDSTLVLWNLESDTRSCSIPHDAKLNAIEGLQLGQIVVADCSPVIRVFDLSAF